MNLDNILQPIMTWPQSASKSSSHIIS
uniref:Uncharacterized protein n=1 Tax=Arundo donax TaxID=35708 RepID=A0A0A9GW68_ARUDO